MRVLLERYERLRSQKVDPREDNALNITTDGRKLATDARMLSATAPDFPGSKVNVLVENVAAIWERTAATRGTQMIFCDMGVHPTPWGYSAYDDIITKLVGHTHQFRAAVAQNAVTDLGMMWALSDIQSWTDWEFGGRPWEVPGSLRKHSPLTYAAQIKTPTLILHSRDDRRCPLPMGRVFHQALLANKVPTQLVIYPGEGHGIRQPRHQEDVLRRTLAWFEKYDRK